MNLLNLLESEVQITFYSALGNVPLTGLTKFVSNVINFFSFGGFIAIGILIFSLLLKIIPLPFDIYSRISNKKNAIKMEKMRPELERLQKQYANNKELYNQKMMALQKKEGYSPFAACLPTLFTLVFFIIVITAFNQYSSYTKVDTFNNMANAYNYSVISSDKTVVKDENDAIIKDYGVSLSKEEVDNILNDKDSSLIKIFVLSGDQEEVIKKAQDDAADSYFENSKKSEFLWIKNIWVEDLPWKKAFISKQDYEKIFTYSKGCKSTTISNSEIKSETAYELLTGSPKLDEVKNSRNGYLILVVLSIGLMLLSQLVMNKTQKTQLELQSVDGANGQAAQTTKMMTWMMPIMFGFFAFMYSASFSLYLVVSTLFSTGSTVLINKIVEKKFKKQAEVDAENEYQKRYGHILKNKKD